MGDYFDWWISGGDWYDRKQAEQIGSLAASHARTTSRLSGKLQEERKRSDDLATRLSKLEDAVLAIVELEDLRGVIENFSDSASTRRYARDVLARIPALGRVPSTQNPQMPPDVPGYWLHPAVRAVDAQLRGDAATQATASAEARLRDPVRTAQFFAAIAILLGSAVSDDDLATLWPRSRQVSQYQRSLWLAVACGGLGDAARDTLVTALRWVLRSGDETAAATEEEGGERFVQVRLPAAPTTVEQPMKDLARRALVGPRSPSSPAAAADLLSSIRESVETGLAAVPSVDDAQRVPEGVPDLLAQVVSAGAPDEEPIVARLVEIREALARIGATTSIAAPVLLDEQSLDLVELLRADLTPAADPRVRGVALRVIAEEVGTITDELASTATEPVEQSESVRVPGGVTVTVTAQGPQERDWSTRVVERVTAAAPSVVGPWAMVATGALLALGGLALTVVAGLGWLVLVAAGVGLGGYGVWDLRRRASALARSTSTTLAAAERAITEKSQSLQSQLIERQARQGHVPEDRDAIHAVLATATAQG